MFVRELNKKKSQVVAKFIFFFEIFKQNYVAICHWYYKYCEIIYTISFILYYVEKEGDDSTKLESSSQKFPFISLLGRFFSIAMIFFKSNTCHKKKTLSKNVFGETN